MNAVREQLPVAGPTRSRRGAAGVALAAAMAVLVVVASVVAWSALRDESDARSLTADGLELQVTAFSRRADAMMGVNTPKEKTRGPGMSMPGMGSIPGALPHGQERVDVQVEVHNTGQRPVRLDAASLQLWKDDEQVQLLQPTVSDISGTTLEPGSRMVGTVTFVVAQGTAPLALRFAGEETSVTLEETSAGTPHDPDDPDHQPDDQSHG